MRKPLVSIVIRTCQRPQILERALNSVQRQIYENIQVVVVEDGENTSEELIKKKYSKLNCKYVSTGKRVGRAKVGNIGLEMSDGEYINFLDDDDILLENHVEILIERILESKSQVVYSIAEEHQITIKDNKFNVRKKLVRYNQQFNRLLLYTFNYLPIQSVMFNRNLFEEMGGFDENLSALEDWDMWVRYSLKTDFIYINQITSIYYVPYKRRDKLKRKQLLDSYLNEVYKKFESYELNVSISDINSDMRYVIREYKNKGLLRYCRMLFRALLLGEK